MNNSYSPRRLIARRLHQQNAFHSLKNGREKWPSNKVTECRRLHQQNAFHSLKNGREKWPSNKVTECLIGGHFFAPIFSRPRHPKCARKNVREKWQAMKRVVHSQTNIKGSMKIDTVLTQP